MNKFGKPLECDFPHNTVFPGVNSHKDYLNLLQKYVTVAPYLLPRDLSNPLNRPTIRHPGMPLENFISPIVLRLKVLIFKTRSDAWQCFRVS